jgi:hypothetical protein
MLGRIAFPATEVFLGQHSSLLHAHISGQHQRRIARYISGSPELHHFVAADFLVSVIGPDLEIAIRVPASIHNLPKSAETEAYWIIFQLQQFRLPQLANSVDLGGIEFRVQRDVG